MKKYMIIALLIPSFTFINTSTLKSKQLTPQQKQNTNANYTPQKDDSSSDNAKAFEAELTAAKEKSASEKKSKSSFFSLFKCCCCGRAEK